MTPNIIISVVIVMALIGLTYLRVATRLWKVYLIHKLTKKVEIITVICPACNGRTSVMSLAEKRNPAYRAVSAWRQKGKP